MRETHHCKKSRKHLPCPQWNLVEDNERVTIEEIVSEVGIAHGSAFTILTENLCLNKISVGTMEANEVKLFKPCATEDDTWIYQVDSEDNILSKEWHPKGISGSVMFKAERSVKKFMAIVFRDSKGLLLIDFVDGQKR
nr:transposase [Hymenolepis microstoma]